MKNRFTVVYTIFAAFVFIFSLAFFGYNLYSEYSVNYEKSESKFAVLPEINLAWSKGNYFFVFISWFNYTISYNF